MAAPPAATPLRVALGLGLTLAVGLLLVAAARRAAGRRSSARGWAGDLALAWALGPAAAVPLLLAAAALGLPLRGKPLALALAALAAAAAGLAALAGRWRRRGGLPPAAPPIPDAPAPDAPAWLRLAGGGAVAGALALALVKLARVPPWSWDHFAIWGLKARLFAAAGSLDPALVERFAGVPTVPDYPLGVPLWALAATLGALPDAGVVRLLHAGGLVALVVLVHAAAARLSRRPLVALAAAGWVAVSPLAWDSIHLGIADLPLALVAVAAVAAARAALDDGAAAVPAAAGWALAGLLVGFLPWVKSEGAPLAALVGATLALWRWRAGRGGRLADLAALAVPALVSGGAAVAFGRWLLPDGVDFLDGPWRERLVDRLAHPGEVLAPVAAELAAPDWLAAWPLLALAALAAALARRGAALTLALVAAGQLGLYVAVFFASYIPPGDHVATALGRTAAAVLPLAVLAAAALPRRPLASLSQGDSKMSPPTGDLGVLAALRRFAADLRYPQLFFLTAALFVLDLAIPDLIPFADEVLLGLLTLLLSRLRERHDDRGGRGGERKVKNVTPER